jgi:hypothetical protein
MYYQRRALMAGRQSICEPPEALANSAHTRRKRRHRWRTFPQPALTFPQRVTVQPDQLSAGGRAQGRARPSAPTAAPTGLIAAAATADVAAEPLSSPKEPAAITSCQPTRLRHVRARQPRRALRPGGDGRRRGRATSPVWLRPSGGGGGRAQRITRALQGSSQERARGCACVRGGRGVF